MARAGEGGAEEVPPVSADSLSRFAPAEASSDNSILALDTKSLGVGGEGGGGGPSSLGRCSCAELACWSQLRGAGNNSAGEAWMARVGATVI